MALFAMVFASFFVFDFLPVAAFATDVPTLLVTLVMAAPMAAPRIVFPTDFFFLVLLVSLC